MHGCTSSKSTISHLLNTFPMKKIVLLMFLTVCWATAMAQSITVRGKVSDQETKEAVIGASISVKGSTKGTVTDVSGNFSLNVTKGATLVISSIGYDNTEVTADADKLEVLLKANRHGANRALHSFRTRPSSGLPPTSRGRCRSLNPKNSPSGRLVLPAICCRAWRRAYRCGKAQENPEPTRPPFGFEARGLSFRVRGR